MKGYCYSPAFSSQPPRGPCSGVAPGEENDDGPRLQPMCIVPMWQPLKA